LVAVPTNAFLVRKLTGDHVDLAADFLWLRGSQPLIPTALYIVAA
jgi:hypothetical protein